MDIQDQLNTAFIADGSEFLEELEFSLISQPSTNKFSSSKINIQDELNTAFIADDSDFMLEFELSLIDPSIPAEDTPRWIDTCEYPFCQIFLQIIFISSTDVPRQPSAIINLTISS